MRSGLKVLPKSEIENLEKKMFSITKKEYKGYSLNAKWYSLRVYYKAVLYRDRTPKAPISNALIAKVQVPLCVHIYFVKS